MIRNTRQPYYALPVRWDFPCWTNSDYTEELSFQIGSEYLDLTGHSFEAQLRTSPNAPTVLKTLSTVGSPSLEGFHLIDAVGGALQIRVNRSSVLALYQTVYPTVMEGDDVALYYDLLVTLPGGGREAWLHGFFNINKGITNG